MMKIIQDSIRTILAPQQYFQSMSKTGGFGEPILKVVIYGLIAGLISFGLSFFRVGAFGTKPGLTAGLISIVLTPIFSIVVLFIGAAILLLLSAIASGDKSFESVTRVMASLMVLSIVNALTGFTYLINFYVGYAVGIALSLFGLYLLYHGLSSGLQTKPLATKIIMSLLFLLMVAVSVASFFLMKKAAEISQSMIEAGYTPEKLEEMRQNPEAFQKDIQRFLEEVQQQPPEAMPLQEN